MENKEKTVSLQGLLRWALAEQAEQELRALPTPGELNALFPDTAQFQKRVLSAAAQLRKKQQSGRGRPLRIVRRTLIAAAILVSLLSCTLMVNASVRATVVNTIIEWTSEALGIQFEIAGTTWVQLPEGYGPHYIPEGLVYDEENSSQIGAESAFYTYKNEDTSDYLDISVYIAQNGSAYSLDNEHAEFDMITFLDATAYVGQQQSLDGAQSYVMLWTKDGIEHYLRSSLSLTELMKVAENIY